MRLTVSEFLADFCYGYPSICGLDTYFQWQKRLRLQGAPYADHLKLKRKSKLKREFNGQRIQVQFRLSYRCKSHSNYPLACGTKSTVNRWTEYPPRTLGLSTGIARYFINRDYGKRMRNLSLIRLSKIWDWRCVKSSQILDFQTSEQWPWSSDEFSQYLMAMLTS